MDINLNNLGLGNVGYGRESSGAGEVDAGIGAKGVAGATGDSALRISSSPSRTQSVGIASSEPVADVPDSALVRDDALGKLVGAAFNLPPPAMPDFS